MSEYDPFLKPRFDFGTCPQSSPEDIQQHYDDTCAIRCQEIILRDFGIDLPEDVFVQEAADNGWYEPGEGTPLSNVGNILELHGVPVQQYSNANIYNLVNELGQGHRVIVAVDADELWEQNTFLHDIYEIFQPSGSNHALIVSKIDVSDPDDVRVILTDPGSGDVAKEYTLEEFQDAWEDSNCFMVSTQDPPPENLNLKEMRGFDYGLGHIKEAFSMPWDQFHFACDNYDLMNLIPGTAEFRAFHKLMEEGSNDWSQYDDILEDDDPFETAEDDDPDFQVSDDSFETAEDDDPNFQVCDDSEEMLDDSFPDSDSLTFGDSAGDFIDPFNS